ncbi:hypothetical protein [Nocardia gamkensis]|uniref:Uncharacterized protein n=1 Tax=Nocardia gamkensis TaxID=352869 RepID=A0A7X6L2I0_9NOCA|nr:hypothetical protein [Nocardia gamkensis]NKY26577.1 hypothetical protein [Nocardia gamkensis]NQE67591.1 hypothetical protein [Nocardia gamkensis]
MDAAPFGSPAAGAYQPATERLAMDLPACWDDEDARKLALAPSDGARFLHHADGSWELIGDDGWPVNPQDLEADVLAAIAVVTYAPIDIEPISLGDNEIR